MKLVLVAPNAFTLHGAVSPKMHDTIQTLPGKKNKHQGVLKIELSEENIAHITIRHPEIDMDDQIRMWYSDLITVKDRILANIDDFPFKTTPYLHQLKSLQAYGDAEYFGLLYEMGAGKTKANLDIASYKYMKGEIENLIVCAPNGVHRQWIMEQVPVHVPDQIQRAVLFTTGSSKSRNIGVEEILGRKKVMRIFAVNTESMSHKNGFQLLEKIVKSGPTMITVDESSSIKGFKSARTESAHKLARMQNAVVRSILDGTPISQGGEDLWGPLEFLSPHVLACSNYYAFRSRYLVMGGQRNDKVVAYKNLEDLQRRLYTCCDRVLKSECLDLPGCIPTTRYVEMTPEQEKAYNDMKELFFVEVANGEIVTVKDAMVRINKMQQILGGFVITKHPDGVDGRGVPVFRKQVNHIGTSKLDAALDLVREHGKKTLIWVNFREEADLLEAHLKANTNWEILRYTGKETEEQANANKQRFMDTSVEEQVLICSMKGSRGLNLPMCSLMIWMSFPRKYLDYRQGNERTDRPGQNEKTTIVHLMVPKTVDERAFRTLMRKEEFATMMLDIRDML